MQPEVIAICLGCHCAQLDPKRRICHKCASRVRALSVPVPLDAFQAMPIEERAWLKLRPEVREVASGA